MSSIDYSEKIPNNVNLSEDRTLQRALESWQPNYLEWWQDMGPDGSQNFDVYLRTAISVDPQGWAQFGHVKMPDYRWGIFLNPAEKDRKIHFGDHLGEDAWQDVPGEHRANLRRIIVTQGDTEPASVEQQRHLGLTCPSQYDLRNLFQVNVEEGRHLWAMVYLLHKYFGRDGREEGEALLERRSGNADNPRILQAFNEKTPDWLSFFMFTYFTDRDGKFQLCALAESSFDPLARTTKFMLTEEAHHMFVGESGVGRVIQRTVDMMNQLKTDDPAKLRAAGVIDLPTIQRYLNFHFSVTIDLFGADESSNAATFYSTGLKGRYEEGKRQDDHVLKGHVFLLEKFARAFDDIFPKSQPFGYLKRIGFPRNTDIQMVCRAKTVNVKFHARVLHPGMCERKRFDLAIVRGRHGARALLVQRFKDCLRKRRALDRIRACAQFVKEYERMDIRLIEDTNGIRHMRRKRGKRLFDRLFIPDVRKYFIKHGQTRPERCRHEHAGHSHERKQAHGLQRDRLSTRIRSGDDQRCKVLAKPNIHRYDGLLLQQRMSALHDTKTPIFIQLGPNRSHIA